MHSMDDHPQLMSKFSSDGEESFTDHPETNGPPTVSREKVQNLTGRERVVGETGTGDRLGTGSSSHPPKPKPISFFNRLTSKLRIKTPPPSPLPASPSHTPSLSPRPNINSDVHSFAVKDVPEAVFHERRLLSPKDLSVQETEQDKYLVTIGQDGTFEHDMAGQRLPQSKKIQEEWQANRQVLTNGVVHRGMTPVRPQRPKSPIYPTVLTTPQFGRSRSTPDFGKHTNRLERVAIVAQSAPDQSTSPEEPVLRSPRETLHSLREETHYIAQPQSPRTHKWFLPPPDRSLPPVPVDVKPPPASLVDPIEVSSLSAESSGRNSFVAISPFTPTIQDFTLDSPSTPASPGRKRYLSERGSASPDLGAMGEIADDSLERMSRNAKNHVYSGDASPAVSTVAEESDSDVLPSIFSVTRPKRRDRRGSNDEPAVHTPRRPRTADSPRPKTSDSVNSSQGRSPRRKSFVGQSFYNLRKSVADSITKARPKSPAMASSTSLVIPWRHDVSQLPPSPTLPSPFPPSPMSESHTSGSRGSLGISPQR